MNTPEKALVAKFVRLARTCANIARGDLGPGALGYWHGRSDSFLQAARDVAHVTYGQNALRAADRAAERAALARLQPTLDLQPAATAA
jgi:hypothetical protein